MFIVNALNQFQARAWRRTGKTSAWRMWLFSTVADRLVKPVAMPDGSLRRTFI